MDTEREVSGDSNVELDARFIRQEHRLYWILKNAWDYRDLDKNDPRARASRDALLVRLVFSLLPVTAMSGASILAVYSVFLAFEANSLIREQNSIVKKSEEQNNKLVLAQNKMIESQNAAQQQLHELQKKMLRSQLNEDRLLAFRLDDNLAERSTRNSKSASKSWVWPSLRLVSIGQPDSKILGGAITIDGSKYELNNDLTFRIESTSENVFTRQLNLYPNQSYQGFKWMQLALIETEFISKGRRISNRAIYELVHSFT